VARHSWSAGSPPLRPAHDDRQDRQTVTYIPLIAHLAHLRCGPGAAAPNVTARRIYRIFVLGRCRIG
jgi:hypothetical protein